ncbi:MAG: hypothetical protein ACXITV_13245 [Luteibaculaceae bacterium]
MRNTIHILLITLLLGCTLELFSQSTDPDKNVFEAQAMFASRTSGPLTDFYNFNYAGSSPLRGTPYLEHNFLPGQIMEKGKENVSGFLAIRYNLYAKKLTFYDHNNGKEWVFDEKEIEAFFLYDSTRISRRHFIKTPSHIKSNQPFLEKNYTGNFTMFTEWQVMFLKAASDGAYARGKAYDEFKKTKRFFIYSPLTNKTTRFKEGRFPFKKIFGEYHKEAKDYAKFNRLMLDKETDLSTLLSYMETFVLL